LIFTRRDFATRSSFSFGQQIIAGINRPDPPLSIEQLEDYLSEGQNLDFMQTQLRRMRKEPMTAEKIDELMDKTDQRIAEKREKEARETSLLHEGVLGPVRL